jgi:hypothetical protein
MKFSKLGYCQYLERYSPRNCQLNISSIMPVNYVTRGNGGIGPGKDARRIYNATRTGESK